MFKFKFPTITHVWSRYEAWDQHLISTRWLTVQIQFYVPAVWCWVWQRCTVNSVELPGLFIKWNRNPFSTNRRELFGLLWLPYDHMDVSESAGIMQAFADQAQELDMGY